ncbi:hypothetical protein DH2020_036944 [Rehmannia glutinosa]|uniref:Uncharacterized protein n=1 Tax=Rehmannia glutinosa TaxID=99300 RepID=A0ABR0V5B1_REHGL
MKKPNNPPFLLLFLFLSLCSASNVSNAVLYNHLQLVYTWPHTFCLDRRVSCKKPVPQNFVLHGLWPAHDKVGKNLIYCSKSGSISWALNKYEKQLTTSWPSLRRDLTNKQFWQYQWDKHGTCVLPRMNVLRYLQLIITLQPKFDLLRALSTNDIKPNGSSYPRKIVEDAIRHEIGGRDFYMSCQNLRNVDLIKEIYVCLDYSGHRVISCPTSNNPRGCGRNKNLVFTAAKSRM